MWYILVIAAFLVYWLGEEKVQIVFQDAIEQAEQWKEGIKEEASQKELLQENSEEDIR